MILLKCPIQNNSEHGSSRVPLNRSHLLFVRKSQISRFDQEKQLKYLNTLDSIYEPEFQLNLVAPFSPISSFTINAIFK